MTRRHQLSSLALLSLAAAAGCGGGGTTTPDAGLYKLRITSTTTPVYGLVVNVSGASETPKLILGAGVTGRITAGSGNSWKVLLVGPLGEAPFLEVNTNSGSAPILTVADASGGRSDSYRALAPNTVKVEAQRP